MMFDPVRVVASAVFIGSITIALFCALYIHTNGSTLSLPMQEPPKTGVCRSLDSGPWLNTTDVEKDPAILYFCGVPKNKCVVKKPGPRRGKTFFGCGNWSVTRGAACQFFEWAVPDIPLNA